MFRTLLTLSLLLVVAFSTASLSAAELSLSLGIRQTFPAGDVDGDLDVDTDDRAQVLNDIANLGGLSDVDQNGTVEFTDVNIVQANLGASTSGIPGDNGGTVGPTATTGSQTLTADGTWQQLTFVLPVNFTPEPSDWGVLESLRFANTADGQTNYKVWIDDIASVNSAGATIFGDFESNSVGEEVLFQEPSVASGGDILGTPDLSEVTDGMAFSGSQSFTTEFEFVDDDLSRGMILSTAGVDNLPNPLIQLREADYGNFAGFSATSVTLWAKAVVVPEPASSVLALSGLLLLGRRRCVCE